MCIKINGVSQLNWQHYKTAFEFDGSWRDIYVLNTYVNDWQSLMDFLRASPYEISYTFDGEEIELPLRVEDIFRGHFRGVERIKSLFIS